MQEKVAVNAPQIRFAALSMYCNFRNVCISKNEIFGILPQLKFNIPGDFSPILQYTLREWTLVTASVRGPSAEKKSFQGEGLFCEKSHPLRSIYTLYRFNAFFK